MVKTRSEYKQKGFRIFPPLPNSRPSTPYEHLHRTYLSEDQSKAWHYARDYKNLSAIKYRNKYKKERKSSKKIQKFIEELKNSHLRIYFDTNDLLNIIKDTHYRNQFETKKSNGSYCHKDRNNAEGYMFGNVYKKASGKKKVKYGLLHHSNSKFCGYSYGKHYIILKSENKWRATFVPYDSLGPAMRNDFEIYTIDQLDQMINDHGIPYGYIEAQIHGDISLYEDVEKIMVNDDFIDMDERNHIKEFSKKSGVPVEFY